LLCYALFSFRFGTPAPAGLFDDKLEKGKLKKAPPQKGERKESPALSQTSSLPVVKSLLGNRKPEQRF
jgi:hypothetical protein